ncbi:polymer-forming cytoskeletal protein [bacterium]|nr:polymer-forming cytoskeletal protein [bacterium]
MRKGKTNTEFGRGGELNTIVGKGTIVEGDLKVKNSLRIDGIVKGNVNTTDTIIVGKDGEVEGRVRAKHLLLGGKVKGNVFASGRVFLESTASVFGDIKAVRLVVDEGAIFDGKCTMNETEKTEDSKSSETNENLPS